MEFALFSLYIETILQESLENLKDMLLSSVGDLEKSECHLGTLTDLDLAERHDQILKVP